MPTERVDTGDWVIADQKQKKLYHIENRSSTFVIAEEVTTK